MIVKLFRPGSTRRPRISWLLVVGLVCFLTLPGSQVGGSLSSPQAATVISFLVDLSVKRQAMDGFGTTVRVWSDPHLSKFPKTVVPVGARAEILAALYRRLGLTRSRQFLDQGIERTPGGSFNFGGKLGADQLAYVKEARAYGLKIAFPAPLYLEDWMKADEPGAYVAYAMTILRYWRSNGYEPRFYSPINEPQISHDFPPQWMHDVVLRLGEQLRAAGFRTRLVIPDDENPVDAYRRAVAVLQDPAARQYVGAVAYHIYRGNESDWPRIRSLASRYGLHVWMTEYGSGDYASWPGVLGWAQTMNDLVSIGGVSAIDYIFGFFGDWTTPGWVLIPISFKNGVFQSFSYAPLYWVVGQYSRFVRPGFRDVSVTPPQSGSISATAFTTRRRLVVVVANTGGSGPVLRFSLLHGVIQRLLSATRSSSTERWRPVQRPGYRGGSFTAAIAPQSVTTFVFAVRP